MNSPQKRKNIFLASSKLLDILFSFNFQMMGTILTIEDYSTERHFTSPDFFIDVEISYYTA